MSETPSVDGGDTEAAWCRLQERLADDRRQATSIDPDQTHRVLMAAAAALAVMAVSGWLLSNLASSAGGAGDTVSPAAAADLPTAPSGWTIPIMVAIGLALVGMTARVSSRRMVTIGVALVVAGVVSGMALMVPSVRTGAALVANAPSIDGYELQRASLNYWPDRHTRAVADLAYAPVDRSAATASPFDDGSAVDALAAELDMVYNTPDNHGYLQEQPRCLQHNRDGSDRGFPSATCTASTRFATVTWSSPPTGTPSSACCSYTFCVGTHSM